MSIYTLEIPTSIHPYFQILLDIVDNEFMIACINICSSAQIRARNRKTAVELLGYVECHHIVPRSFKKGGEKDPSNMAFLTPEEHYHCHELLLKALDGNNNSYYHCALKAMTGFN